MACKGTISKLFLTDSAGRIVSRRTEIWSTKFDRCQDCGTTERPHEAKGLCHPCYVKFRYRCNASGIADKNRARLKRERMTAAGEAREKAREEARKNDPRQRELIRQTKLRWAKRNAKFAAGTEVEYEIIPKHPIRGRVIENGKGRALIAFKTMQEWVPHLKLRKVEKAAAPTREKNEE